MATPRPPGMPFVDYSTSEDSIATDTTAASEEKESYAYERILCEIVDETDKQPRYLVKWVGYPLHRATFEPADSFLDSDTLLEWEKTKKNIASGSVEEFLPATWEKACWENHDKVEGRQARRQAKRDLRESKAAKHESSDDDDPPSKSITRKKKKTTTQSFPAKKGTARVVKKSKVIEDSEDSEDSDTSSDEAPPKRRSAPKTQPITIPNAPVTQYGAPMANMGGSTSLSASAVADAKEVQDPAASTQCPKSTKFSAAQLEATSAPAPSATRATQQQDRIASMEAQASNTAQGAPAVPASKTAPMARRSNQATERKNKHEAVMRKRASLGGAQSTGNHSKLYSTGSQLWRAEQAVKLNQADPDPDMLPSVDPKTGIWTPAKKQAPREAGRQFHSAYDRRSPPRTEPAVDQQQRYPPRREQSPPPPPPPQPLPVARPGVEVIKTPITCHFWEENRCFKTAASCKYFHLTQPKKRVFCNRWRRDQCFRTEEQCEFAHTNTGVYSLADLAKSINASSAAPAPAPSGSGGGAPNQRFQYGNFPATTAPPPPPPAAAASAPPPRRQSQLDTLIGGMTAAPDPFGVGGANRAMQSGTTAATTVPPQQPPASAVGARPAQPTPSAAFEFRASAPASAPAFTPVRHYSKLCTQWAPAIWGNCPAVDKPSSRIFTEEEQDAQIRSLDIKYFEGPFSYGQRQPKKEVLLMYPLNSKYHMSALANWFAGGGCKVTVVSDKEPYKTTWLKWFQNRNSGIVVLDPEWDMDDLPKLGKYLDSTAVAFFNVGICTDINIKKADLPLKRAQTQPTGAEYYHTYGAHHIYPGGNITLITDSIFAHHAVVARKIINRFHEMEKAKFGSGSISKIATRMEVHTYLDGLIKVIAEREEHLTRPTPEGIAQYMLDKDFYTDICRIPEDVEQIFCTPHGEEEPRNIMIPKKSSNLHYAMPTEWYSKHYNFPTDFVKEPCDETEQARRLIYWFASYMAMNKTAHRKFYCIVTPEHAKDKRLIECMLNNAAGVQMMTPEQWLERMDKTSRDKKALQEREKAAKAEEAAKAKAKEEAAKEAAKEAAMRAAGIPGGPIGGAGGPGDSTGLSSAGRQ